MGLRCVLQEIAQVSNRDICRPTRNILNALTSGTNHLFKHALHEFARRNAPEWTDRTRLIAESEGYAGLESRVYLIQRHVGGVCPLVLRVGAR